MMSERNLLNIIISSVFVFTLVLTGCGDPQFLDKTRKDQSILNGQSVETQDPLAGRVVMIAQEIDLTGPEAVFFGLCSGVLIKPQVVLTAAHCLASNTQKMRIILGANPRFMDLKNSRDMYAVADYSIHQDYKNTDPKDLESLVANTDLALIYLDRPTKQQTFEASTLSENLKSTQYDIVMSGFGKTSDLKDTSGIPHTQLNAGLYKAQAKINSNQMTSSSFSLDQWQSSGVCKGDSGSPVFIKNSQTDKLQLFAIAIDVYKNNFELDVLRDPYHKHSTCSGFGLFLRLEPHMQWINSAADSF